jgi:hypothetical protein
MLCSVVFICEDMHTSLNQKHSRLPLHAVLADWYVLPLPVHLALQRSGWGAFLGTAVPHGALPLPLATSAACTVLAAQQTTSSCM